MTDTEKKSSSDRREVLKGLGMGAMGVPLMTGVSSAEQASCSLMVDVEAGEGDADDWVPRDRLTDEFKCKIDISGVSGTHLAYMAVLLNPDDELVDPHTGTFEPDWSSGYVIPGNTWNDLFGGLQSGTYYFYATVADSDGTFGTAVSDSFRVS